MACEELTEAFDNAMEAYDAAKAFTRTQEDNLQQAIWAEQAAMYTAMTLAVLLQACLNGQGGGQQMMMDAFSSPEKLKAKVFELREQRKKLKAVK